MAEPFFTGACPALVTPFTPSGAINYDKMAELIEWQIASGSDALCVAGTTGEGSTLSLREHIDLIRFCAKQINHRVKLLAGAGKNDTATACYLSQRLEEVGADGLLHVTPYYNKTSQTGLIGHYQEIASRVQLPIILYNVPTRTGLSFTAESYEILSQVPNIVGVKEASGNMSLALQIRAQCGSDFHVWSGNDDQVVPMMALGAKGVISVLSNLVPRAMADLCHCCLKGDFSQALDLQVAYADLSQALFSEVNPIPVKTAMNLLGLDVGGLRPPLASLGVEQVLGLRRSLKKAELLCT